MLSMQQTKVLKRLTEVHEQHARAEAARAEAAKTAMLNLTFGLSADQGFRLVF
jgi:hypothetical protein